MKIHSSATTLVAAPIPRSRSGLGWGFVGVLAFSFTVPFTRVAVAGLSPLFIASGRAVIAGLLAIVVLAATRAARPVARQWWRLAVVAGGVVAGFPVLTSYALQEVPASHSAIVIGLLPAATAVIAVWRTGEQPPPVFWWCAALGAVAAVAFAVVQGGGWGVIGRADVLLFAAVLAAAFGYAEGGLLARELGAWQTISWALVLAAAPMVALTVVAVGIDPPSASLTEWAAFGYLAVISMFLGFFAWYRGLAIGPMSQVSQVQLSQPVLSVAWAALLLGEPLTWATVGGGLAVVGCAALAVRARWCQRANVP